MQLRNARRLEYFTIGWNCVEGLISIGAGAAAGSVSLVGFGLDSFIEVASGAAVLWRLGRSECEERRALRIVGACFLALAAYVAWESAASLLRREEPGRSGVGIAIACAS